MNIIKNLIARIEYRRKETKSPCCNYATEARAEKTAQEAAAAGQQYYGLDRSPRYVVFFVPEWNRWTFAIDMTDLIGRKGFGGYLGYFSQVFNCYTF